MANTISSNANKVSMTFAYNVTARKWQWECKYKSLFYVPGFVNNLGKGGGNSAAFTVDMWMLSLLNLLFFSSYEYR